MKALKKNAVHFKKYIWIISMLKPYRRPLYSFIFFSFIVSFAEISIPLVLQTFIDKVFPNKSTLGFILIICTLVSILILRVISLSKKNILQNFLEEKTSYRLQSKMFEKLRELGIPYYENVPVGETLSLFTNELNSVQQIYKRYFPELIEKALLLILSLIVMVYINIALLFLIIPCFLSYYLIGPYFEKRAMFWINKLMNERSVSQQNIYNSLVSVIEIRSIGTQNWFLEKVMNSIEIFHRSYLNANLYSYLRGTARRITVYFGAVVFFFVGVKFVDKNIITVGEFVSLTFIYYRVMWDLTTIVTLTTEQRTIIQQIDKLFDFFDLKAEIVEHDNAVIKHKIEGQIIFKDIKFKYKNSELILDNFNLIVNPGEKVALVGSSGGGKSTLIKLIGRFYTPQEGKIFIDGISLDNMSLPLLRESIGYVFQETYLFGNTVFENIRFGNLSATYEDVVEAAKEANAHDFIIKLPLGYFTDIGERGIKLSGGQKQRIAIARMFIKNPKIIILDEATSSLDNFSELKVQQAINKLFIGRTVITIAHRLSTVKDYDKIVVLDKGMNKEMGTYEELISKKGLLYNLVKSQIPKRKQEALYE